MLKGLSNISEKDDLTPKDKFHLDEIRKGISNEVAI
jgi:hypothetical protein